MAIAGGDLPDAFHSAWMPTTDLQKYGEQGVFIPLNDLIEEHAPNFKKILDENPDIEKAVTFPDGNIYSFPNLREVDFIASRLGAMPFINQEWLDNLGMDMPETTKEFYEYLKAVKTEDPNNNGQADEIPYGYNGLDTLFNYLAGSFGIANKGFANVNIDLDPETDDLRFYPITDQYKELLEYMNKLFSEELIQKNIFSLEANQYAASFSEGLYGSSVTYSPFELFGEAGKLFVGMPALEGPSGDRLVSYLSTPVTELGAFTITNENKNPEATVRWIDYFYGEEGIKLFFMGIEGETYETTSDGEVQFMDHISNSEDGLTEEQEAAKYLTYPGGGFPSIVSEEYFQGAEGSAQSIEAGEMLRPNLIDEPWSSFIYVKEENDGLNSFGNDIDKYVTEMQDKFIAGDVPFSEWEDYVKTLENMNLEEYMEIKETAYERYNDPN